MIDQMIRCKDLVIEDKIDCICQWFEKCPPQGKLKHWVDGRSAKETAKHWLHTIPFQFLDLLNDFNLKFEKCSPEYVSKFDGYKGNGRNHDLLIIARNELNKNVVISIESKADEPFDKYISEYKKEIAKKIAGGIKTNADNRIEKLLQAIVPNKASSKTDQIRYQLLTAIAGVLAEAKKQNAETAIFVVQTFISQGINKDKHEQNQKDLNYFLNLISDGKYPTIKDGDLLHIGKFPGKDKLIPNDIELHIGKIDIKI